MVAIIDEAKLELIISKSMEIGTYNTLSLLGKTREPVTESHARKQYGSRLIDKWRKKRWIVGYPSANNERAKVYFKRTELETARLMSDIYNSIDFNKDIK